MLFVVIWWFVDARKWFKGPKVSVKYATNFVHALTYSQVNVEHQMLGRAGNAIEGVDNDSGESSSGSMSKDDKHISDDKAAKMA